MRTIRTLLAVALAGLALTPLHAQEGKPAKEDPAHEQLRALKNELVEAINKNDMDALLGHLDKDVVVTWMNAEVSRGPKGVKEYIDRMLKGETRVVESYKTEATVDELTHLYGETGVAYGSSKDSFRLTDGKDFTTNTRWTATLVKKDGKWLVAGFHASVNMFDNPVLEIAMGRVARWTGVIAGVAGLLLGFIAARLIQRRPASGGAP